MKSNLASQGLLGNSSVCKKQGRITLKCRLLGEGKCSTDQSLTTFFFKYLSNSSGSLYNCTMVDFSPQKNSM